MLVGVALLILAGGLIVTRPVNAPSPRTVSDDTVVVDIPEIDAQVSSPLTVSGRARGTWYFEASFPVQLLDTDSKIPPTITLEHVRPISFKRTRSSS